MPIYCAMTSKRSGLEMFFVYVTCIIQQGTYSLGNNFLMCTMGVLMLVTYFWGMCRQTVAMSSHMILVGHIKLKKTCSPEMDWLYHYHSK